MVIICSSEEEYKALHYQVIEQSNLVVVVFKTMTSVKKCRFFIKDDLNAVFESLEMGAQQKSDLLEALYKAHIDVEASNSERIRASAFISDMLHKFSILQQGG